MANLQRLYEEENNKAKAEQENATQFLENIKKKQEELLKDNGNDTTDERYIKLIEAERLGKERLQEANQHAAQTQERLNTVTRDYKESVEHSKQSADDMRNKIEVTAKSAQATVTALNSLVTLGTSVNSFFKSLSEGSLTFGSALSSLISIGGTLVFAINSVSAALKALGVEIVSVPIVG